jgi:hypothetical protein
MFRHTSSIPSISSLANNLVLSQFYFLQFPPSLVLRAIILHWPRER